MSLPPLADLPAILLPLVTRAQQSFRTSIAALPDGASASFSAWPEPRLAAFERVCGASDFVTEQVCRDPQMLLELAESGELERSFAVGELRDQLAAALLAADSEDELGRNLRRQRTRQQVRIIWRDLTRQADLVETCRDLSNMADASIDLAYQWLYQRHCQQFGVPTGRRSGEPQHMVILGMGKLGAVELNLSSDIDLIFAYPEGGETVGVKRALDNQEFFIRLGQRLIKALDPITVDGFVFRVDMRLRPYGSSGALVLSFNALEQYYQDQGRDWERYAMIKARVVGGDQVAGEQLLDMLRPFVYRRYLDFSAIEALRTMKQLIQQEVRRKGMADNIKLGSGGIREVEFIPQAFQLIHGGRDLSLQQRPLLKVLGTLEGQGYLPATVIAELRNGYEFLRYTEHAIQAIADRQTQMLPDTPEDQARIAFMLGFADWSAFHERLMYWRGRVDWHFRQVIADPDEEEGAESELVVGGEWLPLWEESQDEDAARLQLQEGGFTDAPKALKALAGLRGSRNCVPCSAWGGSGWMPLFRVCWPRPSNTPTRIWCLNVYCRWSKPSPAGPLIWCCSRKIPTLCAVCSRCAPPARGSPNRSRASRCCSTNCLTKAACSNRRWRLNSPPSCANASRAFPRMTLSSRWRRCATSSWLTVCAWPLRKSPAACR